MNGDVKSDISTLAFNRGEQLEEFHVKIIRLQQEIMLSGEIVSPTRLLFQYTKSLLKSDKLRYFIAPKMTDLIKFLDNNEKYAVYTGWDIHGIYRYLDTIGAPTLLNTSGQSSHHFIPSYYINTDTASLQPVIVALQTIHKSICECCGRIGHKSDAYIICGSIFIPPSIRRKTNNLNTLHGDETDEPPI